MRLPPREYTGREGQPSAMILGSRTLQSILESGARRLARDYERLAETLAGFHYRVLACPMFHRLIPVVSSL